jgi:uncharacterized protein DUF928
MATKHGLAVLAIALAALGPSPVLPAMAQTAAPSASADLPTYKPPLRGAPGGRVGGASRGAMAGAPVSIELLAPDAHAGQTTSAAPTLYYFASRAITEPMKLTISAPMQPTPLLETTIPSARSPGIQALRLADYRVQLRPGTVYAWSVSVTLDPNSPSRDIVATASIMRTTTDASVDTAVRAAPPQRRAAVLAQAGLWYDAVAAAADSEASDRHAALDALLDQVGLKQPAAVDRQIAQSGR